VHQCPTCGKQLEDSIRFCPEDGTPLTDTAAATSARTPTGGRRPASRELDLPTIVGRRYKLVELRGGGGMAKVYRATDMTLEREVAVKLINPDLRNETEFDARFQREARIASQLADPHIVVVHDFGIDPEHGPFLVMEYLRGQSLRERIQTEGPLPLKAGLQLAGQLLLALVHAHDKGIVHRDIKPDNIFLLSQSGVRLHIRVLDFGIARIYKRDTGGETLTQPGAVLGTPRYMSPEQLAGQPIDARSDLYSAAMVIHEALTGQLPYVGGKKLTELCPEALPALQDLLDQCLKPNPQERPQSALEVYMRLNELGKASGVLLLPPGALDKLLAAKQAGEPTVEYVPKDQTGPQPRRRWLLIAGLSVLALLAPLTGWGLWSLFQKPLPPPEEESLLDFKIGGSRDDLIAALGKPETVWHGAPSQDAKKWDRVWTDVGGILRPSDVNDSLDPEAWKGYEILYWSGPDKQVYAVTQAGTIRAVVAQGRTHAAKSGRGVGIGDSEAKLIHAYTSELPTSVRVPDPPSGKRPAGSKGYRYDRLGIGFVIENEKVVSITLYPPKSP
jgi:serine/threonine-protein kinase